MSYKLKDDGVYLDGVKLSDETIANALNRMSKADGMLEVGYERNLSLRKEIEAQNYRIMQLVSMIALTCYLARL